MKKEDLNESQRKHYEHIVTLNPGISEEQIEITLGLRPQIIGDIEVVEESTTEEVQVEPEKKKRGRPKKNESN